MLCAETPHSIVTATVSNGGGPVTVFFDDFETSQAWITNRGGMDTATTGQWERGGRSPAVPAVPGSSARP